MKERQTRILAFIAVSVFCSLRFRFHLNCNIVYGVVNNPLRTGGSKNSNEKRSMQTLIFFILSFLYSFLSSLYFRFLLSLSSYLLSFLRSSSSQFSFHPFPTNFFPPFIIPFLSFTSIPLSRYPPLFFIQDKQASYEAAPRFHTLFQL